ncbi:hypothetical protein BB560_003691 [Smittium megazygosporum]|uniref:Vacuolar ATPase assembly integral membrane protein VMA21 n=1 Tax=Smittium megazygosporum TaxID=133381 RepID=A0A2T9ZBB8_9FUNG|nr:hypothetical protein BB560_003691 [Smittium megazygosporum]
MVSNDKKAVGLKNGATGKGVSSNQQVVSELAQKIEEINKQSSLKRFWITSLLMFACPLGIYFVSIAYFTDSTTIAGLSAAFAANVVLFAYLYLAFVEETRNSEDANNKKIM